MSVPVVQVAPDIPAEFLLPADVDEIRRQVVALSWRLAAMIDEHGAKARPRLAEAERSLRRASEQLMAAG